ncbi:unnamed protein product, partial [Symbiodinium necroappetens]
MELRTGRPPGAQVLLPRREPPPTKLPGWTAGGSSSSSGSKMRSRFHQGVTAPAVLCTLRFCRRSCRQRWGGRTVAYNFPPGLELDTSIDIPDRPEKRMVKELSRYEDPDDPIRPQAPPRDRKGLWAPPGPQAIAAPEVLVVGLGRRLRADEEDGPRARLGAGAVEALQRRYQVRTHFDADVQGYLATCRASLDKSGRAGVQKIHLMQPLVENDSDVGSSETRVSGIRRLQAFAQSRRERLHAALQDEANALFKETSLERLSEPGTAEDVHPQKHVREAVVTMEGETWARTSIDALTRLVAAPTSLGKPQTLATSPALGKASPSRSARSAPAALREFVSFRLCVRKFLWHTWRLSVSLGRTPTRCPVASQRRGSTYAASLRSPRISSSASSVRQEASSPSRCRRMA